MKVEIETKFNIGDEVYGIFAANITKVIIGGVYISIARHGINNPVEFKTYYILNGRSSTTLEENLFYTKEDLINSLK